MTRLQGCVAIRVRYKSPFVEWLNQISSKKQEPHTLESANEHGVVLLLEGEHSEQRPITDDLKLDLFEFVLRYWSDDRKRWIDPIDSRSFDAHFELETSRLVVGL